MPVRTAGTYDATGFGAGGNWMPSALSRASGEAAACPAVFDELATTNARPSVAGNHRSFPVPVMSSPYGLTAIICNSTRAPAFSAATCTVALAGGFVGNDSLYTALNFAKSSKLVM